MKSALKTLRDNLLEINDLKSTVNLLEWDELVYMPPKGALANARKKSTLARLAHEKFTDPVIGKLLDKLETFAANLPDDSDDGSFIRVTRREYDRATRVPSKFVAELENHKCASYEAWCKARDENEFAIVAPYLEKMIDMSRAYANYFPGYKHIADPLVENEEYGMNVSSLNTLFVSLKDELVTLVHNISLKSQPDDAFLYKTYKAKDQLDFGIRVIENAGFDFSRGRQDISLHPFTIDMSLDDIRITTRINESDFFEGFSSTLHEAGHALYMQGIHSKFEGTSLAKGTSMGVHESQARLWENNVGRSKVFWDYFFPILQSAFPDQLLGVTVDSFYRAINAVKPSLIRTEADEVTYNLHVMIRFDLELQLLEGKLNVKDLPDAWNTRYWSDLGITPSGCKDGVLQDVHWYCNLVGGSFQSYTIGNILASTFFNHALKEHPDIQEEIKNGKLSTLNIWLKNNIYQYGSKYTATELVHRITGESLNIEPYVQYLHSKYSEIYT